MLVFNASNSRALGEKIAKELGVKFENVATRIFPDGETYVRIDSKVEGEEAIIVQSMFPDQNSSLMEFLLIADTLKDFGASRITAVIPYLAYSRQDKRFQDGEALSIKTVAKLMKSVGIDGLITVDTHYHHVKPGEFDFFGIPSFNVSAARLLADHVRERMSKDLMIIGPDLGASEMIKYVTGKEETLRKIKICPICGKPVDECTCRVKEKKYEVKELETDLNFHEKNVLILDDIIASGGTMMKAIEKVKLGGAERVMAAATHGLFLKDSLKKLKEMTDYLVVTDSISTPVSRVSVAPLIAEAIKKIH